MFQSKEKATKLPKFTVRSRINLRQMDLVRKLLFAWDMVWISPLAANVSDSINDSCIEVEGKLRMAMAPVAEWRGRVCMGGSACTHHNIHAQSSHKTLVLLSHWLISCAPFSLTGQWLYSLLTAVLRLSANQMAPRHVSIEQLYFD